MASVAVELLWLVSAGCGEIVQVKGVVAAQVRSTVPVKPLTEATLIVSLLLLVPELMLMGTMVVSGISEKSESGLEMGLLAFTCSRTNWKQCRRCTGA